MFKKAVIATILAVTPVSIAHAACTIRYYSSSNQIIRALENGFNFKNFDNVCKKLKSANAALQIGGQITVLSGTAIAWARVSLRDMHLNVHAPDYAGNSTTTNPDPSMSTAEKILPETIDSAVEAMDLEAALKALNVSRKEVRAAYKK